MPNINPIEPTQPRERRLYTGVLRLSAFSVATVLAVLAMTAVMPPLVADQSDRAVVNAPILLLTSPIHGEVLNVAGRAGTPLASGEMLAHVQNERVDRTTLISLKSKVDDLRSALAAAQQKKTADREYIDQLDAAIEEQVAHTVRRLEGEIAEGRARVGSAEAEGLAKKAMVDRQQSMVSRNVASADLVKPTQHQYDGARFDKDVEVAKLDQKVAQLKGVKQGIFVGNELNSLAVLSQKRRDVAFERERVSIEELRLEANLRSQQPLLEAEEERVKRLTDARIMATNDGMVLSIGAGAGRHVSAGDAIATVADCENTFVVAIFSYRQAHVLAIGTPVDISGLQQLTVLRGAVAEIMPKTSDKTDEQYAIAFPQTERREMYVIVRFNQESMAALRQIDARGGCPIGTWVTVTRAGGWIPSASVVWNTLSQVAQNALGVTSVANAGLSQ